jgi:hypothetical protein
MTRDDIIRMAREAGFHAWYSDPERDYHFGCIERFAALVAAASASVEREACAQVCKEEICNGYWDNHAHAAAEHIANVIRARGNAT